MDDKILTGLRDLGYDGPLLSRDEFSVSISEGPKNVEFTKVVNYLTNEVRTLLSLDEEVNPISSPEDSVAFIMELTSLLKELNCPYTALTQGHVSDRLQTIEDRLLLLDYLATEVMGARILQEVKPDKKIELKIKETPEAANMKNILMTLRFSRPPANITLPQLFSKIIPTIENTVKRCGNELIGTPMFSGFLSAKQWETLNDVEKEMHNEYKIRREMMLTRLDCTIQSFEWSDRMRGKGDLIENVYSSKRKQLKTEPNVDISDLLAARDDLAIIEKTSSSSVRRNTQSSLNKVIIGAVPDRGGRTDEIAPPPPEMPSWQQRSSGPMGGGGRGGGFGGRGGGRGGQSNFQSNTGRPQSYSQGGGNFGKTGSYGGFDSAGNFGSNRNSGNDYRPSSSTTYESKPFDSAGSFANSYSRLANFDTSLNISKSTSFGSSTGSSSNYDNRGFGSQSRSSYDSYNNRGNNNRQDYEQQNKRAKTYDSFQSSRTTYADQYVQESQHNQQYHQRNNDREQGGRSTYWRGGGQGGYR